MSVDGSDEQTYASAQEQRKLISASIPSTGWLFNGQIPKGMRFPVDPLEFMWTHPVVLTSPQAGGVVQSPALIGKNGINGAANGAGLTTNSQNLIANVTAVAGVDSVTWEFIRTPNIFKNPAGTSTTGSTAVWTPAAGNKFRLMGGTITVSKEAAAATAFSVALLDNATTITQYIVSSAALTATGQVEVFNLNLPGNGYLSTTANNVLNINLSATLTAGLVGVTVWGSEE